MSGSAPSSPAPTLATRVMEWSRPVIGVLSLALFAAAFVIAATQKDNAVLQILVGAVVSGFSTILSYYFGSSSGSEKKDTVIASQLGGAPSPASLSRAPTSTAPTSAVPPPPAHVTP